MNGPMSMSEFDYSKLDPGIRGVVRWLHGLGLRTTDSGDGYTKFSEDPTVMPYEDALPYAHVIISTTGDKLIALATQLCEEFGEVDEDVMGRLVEVVPQWPEGGEPHTGVVSIDASFDPLSGSALIIVCGPGLLDWKFKEVPRG